MAIPHPLDNLDISVATLEPEWVVTVDTPLGGAEALRAALGRELPLAQGPYDNCMFVRETGYQTFRALDGSHAGAEGTVQKTPAAQIVFSLPCDIELLRHAFAVIFTHHVNEEPTIRVVEAWGSRSKLLDDKDNPHRYWNREDADALHGDAIEGEN